MKISEHKRVKLGLIVGTRSDLDLHLNCEACGATETVNDYVHKNSPSHFLWMPATMRGEVRAHCNNCGYEFYEQIPGAN